ncbi:hypothetical protein [Agarilytica rhodophyticola]|uniref:hypothetical protein n=1 Tax=Agarilytica rhodophyticola TaxID=1737490 RepID=UPI000B347690|nr:hypothetical protein [Agarilytica rhodophyticola]
MKYIKFVICATLLALASMQVSAQTAQYSFSTHTSSFPVYPSLELGGIATGKVKTEFNSYNGQTNVTNFSVNFENAPNLNVNNFSFDPFTNSYIAIANNIWVFRSVRVELLLNDPMYPVDVTFNIFVNEQESFVGGNASPLGPMLASGYAMLENTTPFNEVDNYTTTLDGKSVIMRLNGNLGRNYDPNKGTVGEGIEVKVLWHGQGEKLLYIPMPLVGSNITPIALVVSSISAPPPQEDIMEVFVRYSENGATQESPRLLLRDFLAQAFPVF